MDLAPSVSLEPWQAVSSTPMTRAPPPVHLPGPPIPTQPPLPPTRPPPPPPTGSGRWNVEVESKEPVYGNCGVFGESDPLYSTVTCPHSSGGSSTGSGEPQYGMIRLPPHAAHHPPSATDSASGASGFLPPRSRNSSSAGSSDLPYSVCTLPRNRNQPTMAMGDRATSLPRSRSSLAAPPTGVNYVTLQFPKSMSAGGLSRADIYNHYRLCHDSGDVYAPHEAVTSHACPHEEYGMYGRARHYGSAGSAGSAHSIDSGSAGRSRTLPRGQKKKVHFQVS